MIMGYHKLQYHQDPDWHGQPPHHWRRCPDCRSGKKKTNTHHLDKIMTSVFQGLHKRIKCKSWWVIHNLFIHKCYRLTVGGEALRSRSDASHHSSAHQQHACKWNSNKRIIIRASLFSHKDMTAHIPNMNYCWKILGAILNIFLEKILNCWNFLQ